MNIEQSKKILVVIPSLEGGGAERVASILLKELSMTDIDIVLVLFSKKYAYGVPSKVKLRYIDIEPRKNFIYSTVKFFLIISKLRKIINEEGPLNILSFMDYANVTVLLSNIFFRGKAGVIISVRTALSLYLHEYSRSFLNRVISFFVRLLYNKADKIIAVSDFSRNDLIQNFGIRPEKIITIYNPVDINKIKILAEEEVSHPWFKDKIPVVLAIGRLSKEKGFDYLLRAFAIVSEKMDVRLLVVGEGEEEISLKNLSKSIGIDKDVVFLGFEKNPYKYMRRATIYVMSSLYEGFPNVLIEAMVCDLPVISTVYNPNSNEIVENEKTGLLVPVADEGALSDAILKLLNDPSERIRLAANAREKVKEFSVEKIAGIYRKALLD